MAEPSFLCNCCHAAEPKELDTLRYLLRVGLLPLKRDRNTNSPLAPRQTHRDPLAFSPQETSK